MKTQYMIGKRLVTHKVVSAFLEGKKKTVSNTSTDGESLYLHGNKIAWKHEGKIYVTLCGWNTRTTRERLNAIPGVHFSQKAFMPYFNGKLIGSSEVLVASQSL